MLAALLISLSALSADRVLVEAGQHTPFYAPGPMMESVEVPAFLMDAVPVTNAQFAAFVQANPTWARGAVPAVFADSGYLSSWADDTSPGALHPDHPVTRVSWFAARAYCQAAGGELPSVYQWEYAADATTTSPRGARKNPETLERILVWYAEGPGAHLRPVGTGSASYWGLHDMHGLVWEWTLDFNSLLIAADIRESGESENLRFCGAGALSARDVEDYATFMRFAMRSALSASYTTDNLGFRCAYSP